MSQIRSEIEHKGDLDSASLSCPSPSSMRCKLSPMTMRFPCMRAEARLDILFIQFIS